jgi:hypothetical protein
MLHALPTSETAPPLYYVVAWGWARVFGFGEYGLRALSALAGTATIVIAYFAARALVGTRAAVAVAALAASSPLLVWYSQEARAYSLLVFFCSLSFLFFAYAWREKVPRSALRWWSLTSALAIATYYYAAFVVAAELCALWWLRAQHRRALALAALLPITVTMALLPLAVYQARQGRLDWIGSLPLSGRVEETLRQLLTPAPLPVWAGAGIAEFVTRSRWLIALALLLVVLALLVWLPRRAREGALIAAAIGFVGVGGPLLVALGGRSLAGASADTFLYRGMLGSWLPLTVLVGAGLALPRGRVLAAGALACLALLCGFSLFVTVQIETHPSLQRDDWRALARATRCGTPIVVSPGYEAGALRHYRPELIRSSKVRTKVFLLLHRHWTRQPEIPTHFRRASARNIQYWTLTTLTAPQSARLTAPPATTMLVCRALALGR